MFAMKTATTWLQLLLCHYFLVSIYASSSSMKNSEDKEQEDDIYNVRANDADSAQSRAMATLNVTTTMPSNPRIISRRNFPSKKNNNNPHVCLAFLSCCGRTDLLNHTLAGAIRHMEEDEPDWLRYEIAWVDNGSGPEHTDFILENYQIDHALTLPQNRGLAYGMNLLIFNLCQAPYILLLEEDWLYLDEIVAKQTPERKRVIASSVSLLEALGANNVTSFDDRNIMGVFLRPESYDSFLTFPHADVWETQAVDLKKGLPNYNDGAADTTSCEDDSLSSEEPKTKEQSMLIDVDYRVYCADAGLQRSSLWGSYTNGAGLYRRSDLYQVGRMFGEPGDAFHDRYVESNYAYRVALHNCHAAVRLTSDRNCNKIDNPTCSAAFHHIGGGRGTRPRDAKGTNCESIAWNFYGTPLYKKYLKMSKQAGNPISRCSGKELQELRELKYRDLDAQEYREEVKRTNALVFERERQEREKMKQQADEILKYVVSDPERLRKTVQWMETMSDEEIIQTAHRMKRLANSPHPLKGFHDMHGRILQ